MYVSHASHFSRYNSVILWRVVGRALYCTLATLVRITVLSLSLYLSLSLCVCVCVLYCSSTILYSVTRWPVLRACAFCQVQSYWPHNHLTVEWTRGRMSWVRPAPGLTRLTLLTKHMPRWLVALSCRWWLSTRIQVWWPCVGPCVCVCVCACMHLYNILVH